jgi:hypothetical protein
MPVPIFPTTPGAFQTTFAGSYGDAFVSKLNTSGRVLLYSTYLGGSGIDGGTGIAVDSSGNAYVTGDTDSSDFPTTAGAFQTTFGGGNGNAFISKLNATGSALVYSTYLGGSGPNGDFGLGLAVDVRGNAYVTGVAQSPDFPTTPGAFQTTYGSAGSPFSGDAFISKLNTAGSALVYSTYLGGNRADAGEGIAVDASGNAYVTGFAGRNLPTTPNAFQTTPGGGGDAFVTKLNGSGSALLYSTYLGGTRFDSGQGIAVDASGNAYVAGVTDSSDFPITPGVLQTTFGRFDDAFVSKFSFATSGPAVTLTPGSVLFRVLRTVGTTSLTQTAKLTNVGGGQLNITGITVTGPDPTDFTQTNNCPAAVTAGMSCLITVTFKPTAQSGAHGVGLNHGQCPRQPADRSADGPGHVPRVVAAANQHGGSARRHLERRAHRHADQRRNRPDCALLHSGGRSERRRL